MAKGRNKKKIEYLASVRRSQLITTYGIGSMLPIEQESFIVLGLDEWPDPFSKYNIDPNTQKPSTEIVEETFSRALGNKRLIQPPSGNSGIPVARFPEYVSCPRCFRLSEWIYIAGKRKDSLINSCKFCMNDGIEADKVQLVTSRFVTACEDGHLQDFPYFAWVHQSTDEEKAQQKVNDSTQHSLSLITSSDDDSLAGISVKCKCGAERSMEGALGEGGLTFRCPGNSPWLNTINGNCEKKQVGLQRGATRVWQAEVRSAISIDRPENPVYSDVLAIAPILRGMDKSSQLRMFREMANSKNQPIELYAAALDEIEGNRTRESDQEIRNAEYRAFVEGKDEITGSEKFVCITKPVESTEARELSLVETAMVPRLREVRALTGFSRVDPKQEKSRMNIELLSNQPQLWVPAIEAFGEGVFIRLSEDAVSQWEVSDFALSRAAKINKAVTNSEETFAVTPRLLLLHSLAHILMQELSLVAGYPASSIRERVFAEENQAGILLYTAGTDSAGSLGGLCALGTEENISQTMRSALETARWCSADPVCGESSAHGVNNRNLVACHYCMLAPEVSCEMLNSYLDRAVLVGTPQNPEGGFFQFQDSVG